MISSHRDTWRAPFEQMVQDERSRSYYIFHDIIAIIIFISVIAIILESVGVLQEKYRHIFFTIDAGVTAIFLVEYAIRLVFTHRRLHYVLSPFGIIDLLSFLPSLIFFIAPTFVDLHSLRVIRVIRVIRLLRLFRILKIVSYTQRRHYPQSRIVKGLASVDLQIYLFTLFSLVTVSGTLIYIAESGVVGSQFTNIPQGMWWALVTVATVGYGDMVPFTVWGKIIASFTMVAGLILLAILIVVVGKIAQIALFGSMLDEEEKIAQLNNKKGKKRTESIKKLESLNYFNGE